MCWSHSEGNIVIAAQWCLGRSVDHAMLSQLQELWFESNTVSVVIGVNTFGLANLPEKHSVAYIWAFFWLELLIN